MRRSFGLAWGAAALLTSTLLAAGGAERQMVLAEFDFTTPAGREGWGAQHDIARLEAKPEGLAVHISGGDPYMAGPARDYPAGQPLWLTLRLRAEESGAGQVFYYHDGPREEASVRFAVRGGRWEEVRLPLPPLGLRYRFRIDPPGTRGQVVLASLRVEPRVSHADPAWPRPEPPRLGARAMRVRAGGVELRHGGRGLDDYEVHVAGEVMATGLTRSLLGYVGDGAARWMPLGPNSARETTTTRLADGLRVTVRLRDADGGEWRIERRFLARRGGGIEVRTAVSVDRPREALFLPMVAMLPGAGSFGAEKGQGLLCGLEYLDNEPSSSEADLIGPAARRQVPDTLKVTLPLMAIQAQGRYLGLLWDHSESFSALFDSPDRLFGSGGHVMGVLFPGSNGVNREEGRLVPYHGEWLEPDRPLVLTATIIGGRGESVVPAVQQYVRLRGLPPVPRAGWSRDSYVRAAAAGWLDSRIREGARFRHAYPGPFPLQSAADAAFFMRWLAREPASVPLADRLRRTADEALAQVPPEARDDARVSHIFYPVASLLSGQPERVAALAARATDGGRSTLGRFEPDGRLLYRRDPDREDYGRTHFAPDANGLTAQVVSSVLEAARLSGDPVLIREGLRLLGALDRYRNTVPRGAQTWEIPLHTPDILASANLVRAYTQGYELSGDSRWLEHARYWAWTGVPFVYLRNPSGDDIGTYATIAVLGATNWIAPVWMGLPVQWCGLVYAEALYRLLPYDRSGPWKQLADGITASGIQQTWPVASDAERQGLLPDSFSPRAQARNDAAINPGTAQACAIRLLGGPLIYDSRAFPRSGVQLHAPGAIGGTTEWPGSLGFTVEPWTDEPYCLLLTRLRGRPEVTVTPTSAQPATASWSEAGRRLILTLRGRATVRLALPTTSETPAHGPG